MPIFLCWRIDNRSAAEIAADADERYRDSLRSVLPSVLETEALFVAAWLLVVEAYRLNSRIPHLTARPVEQSRRVLGGVARWFLVRWYPIAMVCALLVVAALLRGTL